MFNLGDIVNNVKNAILANDEDTIQHSLQLIQNYLYNSNLPSEQAVAYHASALCYEFLGQVDTAISALNKKLSITGNIADALLIGALYQKHGQLEKAKAVYQKIMPTLEMNGPKDVLADAYFNLGGYFQQTGKYDHALTYTRKAVALKPDNKSMKRILCNLQLLLGDFQNGFNNYIYRTNERHYTTIPTATDLSGVTLRILGEQGLGDMLMLARYIPDLQARGAKILLNMHPVVDEILNIHCGFEIYTGEAQVTPVLVGDIPYMLGRKDVPESLKFVRPKLGKKHEIDQMEGPVIGITWRAGTGADGAFNREIDPVELASTIKKGTIVILQRDPRPEEIRAIQAATKLPVVDYSYLNNHENMVTAMPNALTKLDDYVGVANTNFHLFDMLDKRGRMLVTTPLEWRFGKEKSVWWDHHQYRQGIDGNWGDALEALKKDLAQAHNW